MRRMLFGLPLAAACLVAIATSGDAHEAHDHVRTSSFSSPRVDELEDGTVVVSFEAGGDLSGVLTLQLQAQGGDVYAGAWSFMVGGTDNTDPATGLEPENEGHDHDGEEEEHEGDTGHRDFVRYYQRGAIAGTIANAQLTYQADGTLTAINAPLAIQQGSLEFDGIEGSGNATLTGLSLEF